MGDAPRWARPRPLLPGHKHAADERPAASGDDQEGDQARRREGLHLFSRQDARGHCGGRKSASGLLFAEAFYQG